MALLSAFTPRIAYRVDGCPDITIEQAVLDSAIEFCEKSLIVLQTLDKVLTKVGVSELELDVPAGTRITQLMRVWVDGTEIGVIDEDSVDSPLTHVSSIANVPDTNSRPRYFVESSPGVIRLVPTPDAVYTVTARAALKPSRSSTTVDDILFEDWMEAIIDGAMWRLYVMPERWSNPALAKYHMQAAKASAGNALAKSQTGNGRAELRVRSVWI